MKNTFGSLTLLVLLLGTTAFGQSVPEISIVYPKPDQTVTAVDSTFILGHLPDELKSRFEDMAVLVNGVAVHLHKDGGFLGFVAVRPGPFIFHVEAHPKSGLNGNRLKTVLPPLAVGEVRVTVPEPLNPPPKDSFKIIGDYRPPTGDLVVATGDKLDVYFQGSPDATAWFSIPGSIDSVPMAEMPPQPQAYWGEAVFGVGAVPDSLLVRGIYSGSYAIPNSKAIDGVRIRYHLSRAALKAGAKRKTVSDSSDYRVSINLHDYPFAVRLKDSVQTIRFGPLRGYFSIFQPAGIVAMAVGAEGDWYRLQFARNQFGYVNKNSVEPLAKGILPPHSFLRSVRTYGFPDSVVVEFPLSGMHPFRVITDNPRQIRIQLFGVTTDTDWIRYDFKDSLIKIATWLQLEEGLYEFRIELTEDLWGYDAFYRGSRFYFKLIKQPEDIADLEGKTIVIDPGHSADPGSTGPTGLTEAEANLGIALAVRDALELKGAHVVMTRDDDRNVPLTERPVIARMNNADLFISIHNNALPDGVNPFINNGLSTYYYHPQCKPLAEAVQRSLLKETGLPDYGLYHGNLHVARPTQYPAILVECAFMLLPEHEAMLKTDSFRQSIARGILEGVQEFLAGRVSQER